MRKVISFFLACLFLFVLSSAAFADDEVKTYTWSEIPGGLTCTIEEVDADFWMPDGFFPVELTEADLAEDIIGFLANEAGSYLAVFYSKNGSFSLHTFFGYCKEEGLDAEIVTVNDLPALLQRDTANNAASLIFQTQEQNVLQLSFSPLSDETVMEQVFSSVRPHEVIEEAAKPAPANPVSGLISK